MKRMILFLIVLILSFPVLGETIHNRPTSYWWSGNAAADTAWRWAKAIDSQVMGSKGTGSIFYVDSGVTNEGDGTSWEGAKDTLQEAIDLCTANRGDVIYVAQGHAENVASAAAIDCDCAGITIIGLGRGADRPAFSLTATASTFAITDPDVTIINLRFLGAKTSGGSSQCVDIGADGDGATLVGCEFRETSADTELVIMVSITADADDCVFYGNRFVGEAAGGDAVAIDMEGGSDRTVIENNYFYGDWSGYVIDASDNSSPLNVLVKDNVVHNLDDGAGKTIAFDDTATGSIVGNKCYGNGASFAFVGDAMFISPDNICMNTEDVETQTLHDMIGAFTGPVSGSAADDNIKAILDLIYADTGTTLDGIVDDILVDTGTTIPALLGGIGFRGTCVTNAAAGAEVVISTDLSGFGDDYFNTGWSMICIMDDSGAGSGAAPEGEIIDIIDYVSDTGTFTLNVGFTAEMNAPDEIYVRRTEDLEFDVPTTLGGSGNIWYVDAGTSGDGTGKTWENAFATINLALTGATEDNGDVVYVAAGHTETLTAAYDINDHGISIIGIGEGDLQPTVVLNHVDAQWDVTVGDVLIENIKFESSLDNVKIAVDINGAGDGTHIKKCRFVNDGATDELLDSIDLQAGADDVVIESCEFLSQGASATEAIFLGDVVDNLQIKNCWFFGNWTVAPIWSDAAMTNCLIKDNVITQLTSGQHALEITTTATGNIVNNKMFADTKGSVLDPGSMLCSGNTVTYAIDTGASPVPDSPQHEDAIHGIGRVFYVDVNGSNGAGTTWDTAKTTLDAAVNLCTGHRGDYIYVAQGHYEDFTSQDADLDVAGITVIGMGKGMNRPRIIYGHTDGEVAIGADNVTIENMLFISSVTGVKIGIDVEDGVDYFTIRNCEFVDEGDNVGTDEFLKGINFVNNNTGCTVDHCVFTAKAAGAASAIMMDADTDQLTISNNIIRGDYSAACINGDTTASTNLFILDNILINGSLVGDSGLNAVAAISVLDATGGLVKGNWLGSDVATALLMHVADDMVFMDNYVTDDDGDEFDGGAANTAASIAGHTDGD